MEFDEDTFRAIEALRRERGIGVSDAVNELIRRGLMNILQPPAFRQRTADLGLWTDVSSVADALETLEGAAHR